MKTFIFTYNRFDAITTSQYFKGKDHYVLCHTEEQKEKFAAAGKVHGKLLATGQPKGLANNRNFALDMMNDGEWALFFVDDLISLTYLESYYQHQVNDLKMGFDDVSKYRKEFKKELTPDEFYKICEETIQHAEEKGFALCGFSLTDNPLFRSKKFGYWSLADGRCWLIKKTSLRFDTNVHSIEDYCFTTLNLKEFGGIVINNWVLPNCQRYSPGGYGSINERMQQKKTECEYLVKTYPKFIAIAEKKGFPTGCHVRIRQNRTFNKDQKTLF